MAATDQLPYPNKALAPREPSIHGPRPGPSARRRTGSFAPKAQGGDTRSQRIEARGDEVMTAPEEERDQTLVELCERLAARGIATSKSALSRFFQR